MLLMVPAAAVKVLVVEPAASEIDAGTVTSGLSLDSMTATPAAGAACDSVTVQVEDAPLLNVAGVHATELTTTWLGAFRVTLAVMLTPE